MQTVHLKQTIGLHSHNSMKVSYKGNKIKDNFTLTPLISNKCNRQYQINIKYINYFKMLKLIKKLKPTVQAKSLFWPIICMAIPLFIKIKFVILQVLRQLIL